MNSRIIWGIVICASGLAIIIASFFITRVLLIYGIPLLVIGIFILLNKKEDEIEKVNYNRRKK